MSAGERPVATQTARRYEPDALAASLSLPGPGERRAEARKPSIESLPRCAVLVVHGMGQQLRFETLDALANGLYREDIGLYGLNGVGTVDVAHVQFGAERMERVEMRLRRSVTEYRSVDLYEAYWAPLTEGLVTLRDVVAFLLDAGVNGIKNASGTFVRRIFRQADAPLVPVRSLVFFLTALWVILSLILINAAIVAIPAARSPFATPPKWLSDSLFRDLTHLFNATVLVVEAFILSILGSLVVSHRRQRFRRMPRLRFPIAVVLAWVSVALFVVAVFAIVATGIAIPLIFALHLYGDAGIDLVPCWIRHVGAYTPQITVWLGLVAVLISVYMFLRSILGSYVRQFGRGSWASLVFSTVVLILFSALIYGVVRVGMGLIAVVRLPDETTRTIWQQVFASGPVWGVLVLVSLVARRFLIQYAGDVAAYIQPHTVDRFYKVRNEIKDVVRATAETLFAQRADTGAYVYDRILLVGHSLGSVIAYDTLNRLLLDDASTTVAGRPYKVADRTTLLLTFGSPLDKTAFVFTTQPRRGATTDVREALAGVVQPLIDNRAARAGIRWVNIYSFWDIISGRLDFYDDPQRRVSPVENERDPEAVTFLGAHTEYWRNWLVFEYLHSALTR